MMLTAIRRDARPLPGGTDVARITFDATESPRVRRYASTGHDITGTNTKQYLTSEGFLEWVLYQSTYWRLVDPDLEMDVGL